MTLGRTGREGGGMQTYASDEMVTTEVEDVYGTNMDETWPGLTSAAE